MDWRLEARALSRRKADGSAWLIRDASIVIEPGDRIGIHGESGAGKTVFLRALAALDPVESGSIWWSGVEVSGPAVPRYRSRAVYLHQRPALVEGSVEENLARPFALRVHRDRRFDRERATELLESLGKSAPFLAKAQGDLSGGEAQIAALVRALLIEPAILLLDEPTASLDPKNAALVERTLRAWVDETPKQRALVCVSHDAAFVTSLTERRLRVHLSALTEDA